jgi:hypothetical protein
MQRASWRPTPRPMSFSRTTSFTSSILSLCLTNCFLLNCRGVSSGDASFSFPYKRSAQLHIIQSAHRTIGCTVNRLRVSNVAAGGPASLLRAVPMRYTYHSEQWLPYPLELVFAFFANPENLPRLMPHWQKARIEEAAFAPPPPAPQSTSFPSRKTIVAGVGTRLTLSFRPFPYSPLRVPLGRSLLRPPTPWPLRLLASLPQHSLRGPCQSIRHPHPRHSAARRRRVRAALWQIRRYRAASLHRAPAQKYIRLPQRAHLRTPVLDRAQHIDFNIFKPRSVFAPRRGACESLLVHHSTLHHETHLGHR